MGDDYSVSFKDTDDGFHIYHFGNWLMTTDTIEHIPSMWRGYVRKTINYIMDLKIQAALKTV